MTADRRIDAPAGPGTGAADRVLLRYAPGTDRVGAELGTDRYRAYLRRAEAGPVAVGDTWDHFVGRGCGATRDVTLTVAAVEGGDRVGERTAFRFVPAARTDGAGGDGDGEPAVDDDPTSRGSAGQGEP
jgi:hypothetical protein